MLKGLTPQERQDLILSVGTHQRNRRLSPVEVGILFQKALKAGASPIECAQFVHLADATMISRFVRLLNLSPKIQHLVDWGQTGATMSFASASMMGGLSQIEQEQAATEIMTNQMKKSEVEQMIQLKKRSSRPILECAKEVVGMRPSISRKHLFLGAIADEGVKSHLSMLNQNERDDLLAAIIKDVYGTLPKTSARLGIERFTIVTDELSAAVLKERTRPMFETAINQSLLEKIKK